MLYWTTIIATTTLSDFADRSLGIGYTGGTSLLITLHLGPFGIAHSVRYQLTSTHGRGSPDNRYVPLVPAGSRPPYFALENALSAPIFLEISI